MVHYTFFAIGCIIACVLGYSREPEFHDSPRSTSSIDIEKVGWIAIATSMLGLAGMVALSIYIQVIGVRGLWTGWPVYLYTLSKFVFPGLILVRMLYFVTFDFKYRIWSFVLVAPILIQAFQNGRRSWTFLLLFAWFLPAVMAGRVRLRPVYGVLALVGAFFVVTLFPAYRDYARKEGYAVMWQHVKERPPSEVLDHYFSGKQTLEIRDAVVLTSIVRENQLYSYGVRMLNGMIQNYVPGSLIGHDAKDGLKFSAPKYEAFENDIQVTDGFQGGSVKFYTAKTGFFDSYAEFSYFGVLLYFALGYWFRRVEDLCFVKKDLRGVLFMCFLGFLPAAVVYDEWKNVLSLYLPTTFILFLCIYFGTSEESMAADQGDSTMKDRTRGAPEASRGSEFKPLPRASGE
tara:strand:- start:86232 stop:87437 length:1206 start_codon:yes stop_codon:yes gene_type:complete